MRCPVSLVWMVILAGCLQAADRVTPPAEPSVAFPGPRLAGNPPAGQPGQSPNQLTAGRTPDETPGLTPNSSHWCWPLPSTPGLIDSGPNPSGRNGGMFDLKSLDPDPFAPEGKTGPVRRPGLPALADLLPDRLQGWVERRFSLGRSAYLHLGRHSRFHFEFRRASFEVRVLSGRRLGLSIHIR